MVKVTQIQNIANQILNTFLSVQERQIEESMNANENSYVNR